MADRRDVVNREGGAAAAAAGVGVGGTCGTRKYPSRVSTWRQKNSLAREIHDNRQATVKSLSIVVAYDVALVWCGVV